MVIYVDTLVFTNIIIDYILLNITSVIVKRNCRLLRLIIAAVIGGFSSLYIFVQSNSFILDCIFKICIGALLVFIAIGVREYKTFLFSYIVFLGLSFSLSGAVYFLQGIAANNIWLSENLVSYINISPLILIALTATIYLAMRFAQRISDRRIKPKTAQLTVTVCGVTDSYVALVDSGNSISDPFGNAQVFILDSKAYRVLLKKIEMVDINNRHRLIPINTVDSVGLLEGVRCDTVKIVTDGNEYKYNRPVIASSKTPIISGFEAIIPLSSLDRISD